MGPKFASGARWAGAAVIFCAALGPPTALGHTRVAGSNPKPGAVLANAPKAVAVWFTARIPGGSLVVRSRTGLIVSKAAGGRDPQNPRALLARLGPRVGAGRYVLVWKVISGDGHPLAGEIPFRIR